MMFKEVVVILPYVTIQAGGSFETKVVMQLRDGKPGIDFPGFWGFFGGSIDGGESPENAAGREFQEELGYKPGPVHKLGTDWLRDLGNLLSHSYYCHLTVSPEKLVLGEGMDLGLFSLDEVMSKELYSQRLNKFFPVIPNRYIASTIRRLLATLANGGQNSLGPC